VGLCHVGFGGFGLRICHVVYGFVMSALV